MRRRIPIPAPYDDPPYLGPEFNLFLWAFEELSRERDPSTLEGRHISVKRITYKAIREWAEFQGCADDPDLLDELYVLIRALDTVWVEHETKSLRSKMGAQNGKPA